MGELMVRAPKESRYVEALVLCLLLAVIMIAPLRIGGYGYLPGDDALRHTAKVVSEKNWDEILILRDGVEMDSHPGWHAILGGIHNLTNWEVDSLVFFSFSCLFVLFCLVPVFMFDRPEAWLTSLLAAIVFNFNLIYRLLLGRPYIFTMAVVLFVCLIWPRFRAEKTPYAAFAGLCAAIALSTWIHCSWYLFALPVFSFLLARQWRVAFRVSIAALVGITIGACLTGNPFEFLQQTWNHAIRAFEGNPLQRILVTEFQPFSGDAITVMLVSVMLIWRKLRGPWDKGVIDNPVFFLAVTGWVLGFIAIRFWVDWGMPAAYLWIALELQEVYKTNLPPLSWKRFILVLAIAGAFLVSITADVGGRWTNGLTKGYITAEDPKYMEWLPEKGGIVYSHDMTIFYDMFFKNPKADWRYILGFEPTMMPPEDLTIFRNIRFNRDAYKSFEPWVNKMRLQDRLIVRQESPGIPNIPELDWQQLVRGVWVGRIPRNND
jgi:hypothetical protein